MAASSFCSSAAASGALKSSSPTTITIPALDRPAAASDAAARVMPARRATASSARPAPRRSSTNADTASASPAFNRANRATPAAVLIGVRAGSRIEHAPPAIVTDGEYARRMNRSPRVSTAGASRRIRAYARRPGCNSASPEPRLL